MSKKRCEKCNGTGRCQLCRGSGRYGYPGYGDIKQYSTPCPYCQGSGVCAVCCGRGEK